MQEENKESRETKPAPDEVTVKMLIQRFGNTRRYVYSRWKLLFIIGITGAAAGLIYAFMSKPVYTAECTFVLEESDKASDALGQYSSLASMVGIDVGGSSSLFQGDNISQLYNSRLMLEKTLLTPATFNGKSELLINRYIELNKLNDAWKNIPALKNITFTGNPDQFSVVQDSIIDVFVDNLTKKYLTVDKPDKKLSLTSVKVKSIDPLFSKAFDLAIVNNVNTFYIQTKTKSALQNVALLQKQADSVHNVLNSAIGNAAAASDAIPNPDPASLQVIHAPSQRRQVDVQTSSAIYTEVIRNLEIARGSLQRETPLIQVIDQPMLPLPVERTGKIKSALSGFFIAALLAVIWLFTIRVYKGIMS